MSLVPTLLDSGTLVVDLSADFRLADAAVYEEWYGVPHSAPHLLEEAVYGLVELNRAALRDARLIACPGCYPTATLLATAPALRETRVLGPVVVDAKSGVSGAGRTCTPATHYVSANESVTPYSVGAHRHTPEIAQEMSLVAGAEVPVVFAPHLVPATRGLLATTYMRMEAGVSIDDMVASYAEAYSSEPFVTVHESGRMPSTREVTGSNRAHIGLTVDGPTGTLVVTCAIDNLVKGASGQAVQAANVALGFAETDGLAGFGAVV
jgi:N-acetyl-gamma-glutamyl-phosphate reductase